MQLGELEKIEFIFLQFANNNNNELMKIKVLQIIIKELLALRQCNLQTMKHFSCSRAATLPNHPIESARLKI